MSDRTVNENATNESDSLHDECGVFGIWAPERDVARMTYFALHALQHRGQESAGIAVGDGATVMATKDLGLVTQAFTDSDLSALPGKVAIGHVRYGTAGSKGWESAQPHLSAINDVLIALAHNGTLVNFDQLRVELINNVRPRHRGRRVRARRAPRRDHPHLRRRDLLHPGA